MRAHSAPPPSDTQPRRRAWLILIHLIRKLTISRVNTDNAGNCCHWLLLTDGFIKTDERGCKDGTFLPEWTKKNPQELTQAGWRRIYCFARLSCVIKLQLLHKATLTLSRNRGIWDLVAVTSSKAPCQQWGGVCAQFATDFPRAPCSSVTARIPAPTSTLAGATWRGCKCGAFYINLTWATAGSFDSCRSAGVSSLHLGDGEGRRAFPSTCKGANVPDHAVVGAEQCDSPPLFTFVSPCLWKQVNKQTGSHLVSTRRHISDKLLETESLFVLPCEVRYYLKYVLKVQF